MPQALPLRLQSRRRGRKHDCQRRLKWTGQKEPSESSHRLLPSLPLLHTRLSNQPASSYAAVTALVLATSSSGPGHVPASSPPPVSIFL